jgi:hypothetical protein
MDDQLFPIAVVAAEIGTGTRMIEKRCGTGIVKNQFGMRCVPGELVRILVDERDAELLKGHIAQ